MQVYENCGSVIEKGKRIEDGFILAPGCDTLAFAPPVNIYAMTKSVEDFGIYESYGWLGVAPGGL